MSEVTYDTHDDAARGHAADFTALTLLADALRLQIGVLDNRIDTIIYGPKSDEAVKTSDFTEALAKLSAPDISPLEAAKLRALARMQCRAEGKPFPKSLTEQFVTYSQLKELGAAEAETTDWDTVRELRRQIELLQIEVYIYYTLGQTHLQGANKHTNAIKYADTGDAAYY